MLEFLIKRHTTSFTNVGQYTECRLYERGRVKTFFFTMSSLCHITERSGQSLNVCTLLMAFTLDQESFSGTHELSRTRFGAWNYSSYLMRLRRSRETLRRPRSNKRYFKRFHIRRNSQSLGTTQKKITIVKAAQ